MENQEENSRAAPGSNAIYPANRSGTNRPGGAGRRGDTTAAFNCTSRSGTSKSSLPDPIYQIDPFGTAAPAGRPDQKNYWNTYTPNPSMKN